MITKEVVTLVNKVFGTNIVYDNKYSTSIFDSGYLSSLPDEKNMYVQVKYCGQNFEFECEKNPTQFELEKAFLKCLSDRKKVLNGEIFKIDLVESSFLKNIKDL